MNLSSVKSAASYLQTANKVTKPAKKFATAVNETKDGINISAESREVAEHVDEQFDDHTEAVEEAKNVVRNAFDEVSAAAAVACCWLWRRFRNLEATARERSCTSTNSHCLTL